MLSLDRTVRQHDTYQFQTILSLWCETAKSNGLFSHTNLREAQSSLVLILVSLIRNIYQPINFVYRIRHLFSRGWPFEFATVTVILQSFTVWTELESHIQKKEIWTAPPCIKIPPSKMTSSLIAESVNRSNPSRRRVRFRWPLEAQLINKKSSLALNKTLLTLVTYFSSQNGATYSQFLFSSVESKVKD